MRRLTPLAALLLSAACAAKVFVPPTGPGAPAPEAAAAWQEATSACRDVQNVNVTLRVTVRKGRLSLPLSVAAIATSDGKMRLQDASNFAMAGTSGDSRLLLRQDRRYVDGRAEDIVEAFVGTRIGPERMLALMTGCFTPSPASARTSDALQYGATIGVPVDDGRAFVRRVNETWRVSAGEVPGLVVEFRRFEGYWPLDWRAASDASSEDRVVLDVHVEERTVNSQIDPAAFHVNTPAGATPMTLEELRANGPLRKR